MTQLEAAKKKIITPLVRHISDIEGVSAKSLTSDIALGRTIILKNNSRILRRPCAIGKGLSTKINANIGASSDKFSLKEELNKLSVAQHFGADTIMDLSVGGDIQRILSEIINRSAIPVGTVPVYQAAVNIQKTKGSFLKMDILDILDMIESQAKLGVDFFTVHCGVNRKSIQALKKSNRIMGIVSRGGAIIANWMRANNKENPFFEYFDEILKIAKKYDIVLSLGDGLRPGSIFDSTDKAQISELKILGGLAKKANQKGVQVMIEGPGHVPINEVVKNVQLEKKLCNGAPFYILGPLVTDIAAGYDHISSAIGGCLAASVGADFLCYVTPAEHLKHPSILDVKEGVIASKIAAHAADIAKGNRKALSLDKAMSIARRKRDWQKQIKLSFDPNKASLYRKSSMPTDKKVCTMCGEYCSIKLMGNL